MRSKPRSKWNLGLVVGLLILACGQNDENPPPATPPATIEEFSEGPEGCGDFVVVRANRTADRHISANVGLEAIKDAVGPWDFVSETVHPATGPGKAIGPGNPRPHPPRQATPET